MDTKTRLLMMYRGLNAAERLIAINITIFTIMVIWISGMPGTGKSTLAKYYFNRQKKKA